MSAQPAGLGPIGQIAIAVQDLDSAVAFYRDKLGIPFLFSVPGLAFFDCGGIRLMLSRPEQPEFDHPSSVIYFKVDDIHAMHATLTERGVSFDDAPHVIANMGTYDLWMAFFRDQDRNLLGIMGEVAHG
jgi:methylmalonyl-CoA/ethylmalonyl-CoA epimerase